MLSYKLWGALYLNVGLKNCQKSGVRRNYRRTRPLQMERMPVEERILRMSNNEGSYSGQYKMKGEIGLRRGKEPMVVRDISGDQNGS